MPSYKDFTTRQSMEKKKFEIFKYRDTYLREVALHHHDFYEFYLFLSGDVTYSIESRTYKLESGDLLLIAPSELHRPIISKIDKPYERIVLWVEPSFINSFSTQLSNLTQCFNTSSLTHSNLLRGAEVKRKGIYDLMKSLLVESESLEFGADCICISTLIRLAVEVNRLCRGALYQHKTDDKSQAVIDNILKYINENYQNNLTLDALSANFFISKYYLSHEFNRIVGTSVYRYIIQRRLIVAKQLLLENISPTSAARECGFGDYANFYRAFKAEYNLSPKQFYRLHN